jgi:hypothetical protein
VGSTITFNVCAPNNDQRCASKGANYGACLLDGAGTVLGLGKWDDSQGQPWVATDSGVSFQTVNGEPACSTFRTIPTATFVFACTPGATSANWTVKMLEPCAWELRLSTGLACGIEETNFVR